MKNPYTAKVVELSEVRRPVQAPNDAVWKRVENELGVTLPYDYKELVSSIGGGEFGEFALCNPLAKFLHLGLSSASLNDYREKADWIVGKLDLKFWPIPNGLVRLALGPGADLMLRPHVRPGSLDYGLCWLDYDFVRVIDFELSVSKLIYSLYRGEVSYDFADGFRNAIWGVIGDEKPFFRSRRI